MPTFNFKQEIGYVDADKIFGIIVYSTKRRAATVFVFLRKIEYYRYAKPRLDLTLFMDGSWRGFLIIYLECVSMDAIECIMSRNSIRHYSDKPVDDQLVRRIIEAGIAAPSGKNGQPWKFKIITEKTLIEQISNISLYGAWMKSASLFVLCFLDNNCSYDYIKDIQSCGAAMQNMLLAAHASGIGGCWVGEILAKAKIVKQVLSLDDNNLELMGLLTFGHKTNTVQQSQRRHIDTFLL